ncbi:MAG: hypothetical protein ABEH86_02215 [Haloarcula sp.]
MTAPTLVVFGLAVVLSGIAVFNYVQGSYGGAIVSSLGTVIATLFGVLGQ